MSNASDIFLPLFVVVVVDVFLFMNLPNSVTCHVKFLAESSNSNIKGFLLLRGFVLLAPFECLLAQLEWVSSPDISTCVTVINAEHGTH